MRTLKLSGLLALPLALGLAACSSTTVEAPAPAPSAGAGAGASTTTTVTTDTVTVSTTPTTGAMTGTMAGGSAGQPRMLTLASQNNSGFTGHATLTDLGNKVRIALTLTAPANSDKNADHNAHVRSGTCAAPGPIVHELSDVEGNGQASNTELNVLASSLMTGQHVITANENPGDRVVACAAIPQAGM